MLKQRIQKNGTCLSNPHHAPIRPHHQNGASPNLMGAVQMYGSKSMPNELSKSTIGLRAQESHEGLKDITAFGLKEAYLEKTILIGKAASLATHLRST